MRRFNKHPWITLADVQIVKTRTKQYRVERSITVYPCAYCDMRKHRSMCAKIKCSIVTNGNLCCFVLKEIV